MSGGGIVAVQIQGFIVLPDGVIVSAQKIHDIAGSVICRSISGIDLYGLFEQSVCVEEVFFSRLTRLNAVGAHVLILEFITQ